MPGDPTAMPYRRDPMALLRFAVREGDLRLVELVARALRREPGALAAGGAGAPALGAPAARRSTAAPSPLARRTLDALLTLLAIDE